jgi:hypothetical protein
MRWLLADGFIDSLGNIVCPLHRYKYDMKNGHNVTGEGYYLKHWPVEMKENGVFVGMEENTCLLVKMIRIASYLNKQFGLHGKYYVVSIRSIKNGIIFSFIHRTRKKLIILCFKY